MNIPSDVIKKILIGVGIAAVLASGTAIKSMADSRMENVAREAVRSEIDQRVSRKLDNLETQATTFKEETTAQFGTLREDIRELKTILRERKP